MKYIIAFILLLVSFVPCHAQETYSRPMQCSFNVDDFSFLGLVAGKSSIKDVIKIFGKGDVFIAQEQGDGILCYALPCGKFICFNFGTIDNRQTLNVISLLKNLDIVKKYYGSALKISKNINNDLKCTFDNGIELGVPKKYLIDKLGNNYTTKGNAISYECEHEVEDATYVFKGKTIHATAMEFVDIIGDDKVDIFRIGSVASF